MDINSEIRLGICSVLLPKILSLIKELGYDNHYLQISPYCRKYFLENNFVEANFNSHYRCCMDTDGIINLIKYDAGFIEIAPTVKVCHIESVEKILDDVPLKQLSVELLKSIKELEEDKKSSLSIIEAIKEITIFDKRKILSEKTRKLE